MKWMVNSYQCVSNNTNETECIESKEFDDYKSAKAYYWENKSKKRDEVTFTLKPIK